MSRFTNGQLFLDKYLEKDKMYYRRLHLCKLHSLPMCDIPYTVNRSVSESHFHLSSVVCQADEDLFLSLLPS